MIKALEKEMSPSAKASQMLKNAKLSGLMKRDKRLVHEIASYYSSNSFQRDARRLIPVIIFSNYIANGGNWERLIKD